MDYKSRVLISTVIFRKWQLTEWTALWKPDICRQQTHTWLRPLTLCQNQLKVEQKSQSTQRKQRRNTWRHLDNTDFGLFQITEEKEKKNKKWDSIKLQPVEGRNSQNDRKNIYKLPIWEVSDIQDTWRTIKTTVHWKWANALSRQWLKIGTQRVNKYMNMPRVFILK